MCRMSFTRTLLRPHMSHPAADVPSGTWSATPARSCPWMLLGTSPADATKRIVSDIHASVRLAQNPQPQRLGQRPQSLEDVLGEVRRDVGDDEADLAAGPEVLGLDVDALLGHQAVDRRQH